MSPDILLDGVSGLLDLDLGTPLILPYCENMVQAGDAISNVRDDHQSIDLVSLLGLTEECFIIRVNGLSMTEAGIDSGDTLIVRRTREAKEGDIVIAEVDGRTTVKTYHFNSSTGCVELHPHSSSFHPIIVHPGQTFCIIGVVMHCVKEMTSQRPT